MPVEESSSYSSDDLIEVDLRDPKLAAFLAWLWPGGGHIYQRRYAKGVLFMVCILGTYFYGLAIAGGHCVYASWKENDRRWQYFCQLGVGAPALPAVVQSIRVNNDKLPLFVENYFYRPLNAGDDPGEFRAISEEEALDKIARGDRFVYPEAFMAPPGEPLQDKMDLLAHWHKEHTPGFELGTLFTVIAGLLNVLAIYDAFAGPAAAGAETRPDKPPSNDRDKEKQAT